MFVLECQANGVVMAPAIEGLLRDVESIKNMMVARATTPLSDHGEYATLRRKLIN